MTQPRKDEWVTRRRADVRTANVRAALNANTRSLNATKSIMETITGRARRIYTLAIAEADTNEGALLMDVILSTGGSGLLTGPLLLSVPTWLPKLNSGSTVQPAKSQPIISAFNINVERWLISWPLLSERSLLSTSKSTLHQQKNIEIEMGKKRRDAQTSLWKNCIVIRNYILFISNLCNIFGGCNSVIPQFRINKVYSNLI